MIGCIALSSSWAKASDLTGFDLGMIKSLGLDPKVGKFFGQKARFTQGAQRIALNVNGSPRGAVIADFDSQGELCFNNALLERAGLVTPHDRYKLVTGHGREEVPCYDFVEAFPQTQIELKPGSQEVLLLVSDDAIQPLTIDVGAYQYGGTAGIFNYEVATQVSQFAGQKTKYSSAYTEIGFNAGDWIVRSRQSYTAQDAVKDFQMLYSYAQKSFAQSGSKVQLGQINITDSALPGASITGLQWVPEGALQQNPSTGATVEGIAQQQARVEIRQNGALIHSSRVPAGPFRLQNIQLISGSADLDVRVIEDNGGQRSFTVAASSLGQVAVTSPGYSMAVGKVRTFDSPGMQSPLVVTGTGGWAVDRNSILSAGVMVAENKYRATGMTFSTSFGRSTALNMSSTLSSAGSQEATGGQVTVGISQKLTDAITASVNFRKQSIGYRDLMDSVMTDSRRYDTRTRDQYGVSLGWNNRTLGTFSAGYSVSKNFNGSQGNHLLLSWNKQFKYATVGLNLESSENISSNTGVGLDTVDKDKAIYLTISAPLRNGRSIGSYANKRNGNTRFGATYNDTSNDLAKYRLTASQDGETRNRDFSGNVNLLPRYTQLDLGYAQNGSDSSSYNARVQGGVAVKDGAMTLSPYQLNDTFGIAKVGKLSGVKIDTPSGPVWTDPWGRAVLPQLNAYKNSKVEILTKSLPRNVDIKNGIQEISLGRGAVGTLDFAVETQRRVLLKVTGSDGKPIRKGAAVLDALGQYVTSVVDGGQVLLNNVQLSQSLSISQDGGASCDLKFKIEKEPDLNVYYEQSNASCISG